MGVCVCVCMSVSNYVCKGAERVHVSEPAELTGLYVSMCTSEYTQSVACNLLVWKHVRSIHL